MNQSEYIPQLPPDFQEKMKKLLGGQWNAFRHSYEQPPRQGLHVNTLKVSSEWLLSCGLFGLEPVGWAKDGFYYASGERPGRHPFHEAGAYYIQEPSAMAPAGLLEACPGERILDLCAAPGGKTVQIAAAMKGEGLLMSNEIHSGRARILSQNVERMGIRNCLVTSETPETLARRFPGYFHKILADAPCSGEGMFRKDPQSRTEWSLERVGQCARRQSEILDCAARMLAPGGRLVYSTCTFSPEENEENADSFLSRHPEFQIEKTFRLWPHLSEGEGHFAAVFRKSEETEQKRSGGGFPALQKSVPEKELPEAYREFTGAMLMKTDDFSSHCLFFGEHLYLFPEQTPDLKGLKTLRPGLELGVMKKGRFLPAHALALALKTDEVLLQNRVSYSAQEALRYLRGETFPADGVKGWRLVCVENCSLGWGKAGNGQLKNHYPKGLRRN